MQTERNMGGEMTDEQMKELAELRVAIQDLKYQLIQKHDLRELSDATIRELSVAFMLVLRRTPEDELFENVYEYSKLLLKKARGQ